MKLELTLSTTAFMCPHCEDSVLLVGFPDTHVKVWCVKCHQSTFLMPEKEYNAFKAYLERHPEEVPA